MSRAWDKEKIRGLDGTSESGSDALATELLILALVLVKYSLLITHAEMPL